LEFTFLGLFCFVCHLFWQEYINMKNASKDKNKRSEKSRKLGTIFHAIREQ